MNQGPPASQPTAGIPADGDVIEVALLLPARRLAALEEAARLRGLTIGQLARQVIYEFLDQSRAHFADGRSVPDVNRG